MSNFKSIGLILLILFSSAAKALAGVYDAPHKWTDPKTNRTLVYIPGTPGQTLDIMKERTQIEKAILYNNCGFARLGKGGANPITWIIVQGAATAFPDRSQSSANPTCTKNKDGVYESSWEAMPGKILETPTAYFIWGGTPNIETTILVTQEAPLTRKVNPCGLLVTSYLSEGTKFKVNGTQYEVDALPEVTDPIICWKTSTGHTRYIPDPN
jgi:hypothetical protein